MPEHRYTAWFLEPDVFSDWLRSEVSRKFAKVADPVEAEFLFVRVGYLVNAGLLDSMPKLRVVVCPTTGIEHIDVGECRRRNIAVLTLKGETAFLEGLTNTSEHAFALLLVLYRRLIPAYNNVLAGDWLQSPFRGRTLSGKNFGVVGYGRLGKIAARIARGFAMNVLVYDPYVEVRDTGIEQVRHLETLAARSQVLSLHADLHDGNYDMVGDEVLRRMPEEAVLINTARGQLVDESALLDALETKGIAGAGLDVIRSEASFETGNPLLAYARMNDNLVITPHIGGQTEEAVSAADNFILKKLDTWLKENDS